MATSQVLLNQRRESLATLLKRLDSRLRRQQTIVWLPRSMLPGLLLGIGLATLSRTRPLFLTHETVIITLIALVAGILAMAATVQLWPRESIDIARRYDGLFGLQERVATAWELTDGRIKANFQLTIRQLDDAWNEAKRIRPEQQLALRLRYREWGLVALLVFALAVLLLLPNRQTATITRSNAQQAAIDDAAENLRQITQDVAGDASLAAEDREQLLETLEQSTETLERDNLPVEEAFAALADAETQLQENVNQLGEQLTTRQNAFDEAGRKLNELPEAPSGEGGNDQSNLGLSEQLNSLAQSLDSLSDAQQLAAADTLEQAAQSLEQSNPQLAQALQDAADALRSGDTDGAREALEDAANQAQQEQQNQLQQSNSLQNLQRSAQQAQQSGDEVRQSAQQAGSPPQQSQQQQAQQPGQQQQGQQGQQQQGQQQQGQQQQGQQQGQQGQQPGASQSNGATENGAAGPIQQGQQGQQNQQSDSEGQGASSFGAGDVPGGAGEDNPNSGQASGQIAQDNNPDGTGVGQFDPVFAPRRLGGQSDSSIVLEPDASNVPIVEGDFSANPEGNVTVPYSEVFSDYSDDANRALESDYVPLGLRDVVRNYFSSLEPGTRDAAR